MDTSKKPNSQASIVNSEEVVMVEDEEEEEYRGQATRGNQATQQARTAF